MSQLNIHAIKKEYKSIIGKKQFGILTFKDFAFYREPMPFYGFIDIVGLLLIYTQRGQLPKAGVTILDL